MLCVYSMFLIALSSIAATVLLAIGPLFIVMLLFDGTRRYFEAWIGQLANYALITILTVLVAALLLHVVQSYAAQTAARGAALLTVDALDMVLMSTLVFLLMRQIMPIAAGLAGGVALASFGLVSRGVHWGIGRLHSGAMRALDGAAAGLARDSTRDRVGGSGAQPSWRDPA
jgi:type IV secretion system protein VirB6